MAQSFNTNLSNIAAKYTRLLTIPVTATTLKENLQQNPFYPSLYCLSNVFDKLNIPNQAFNISAEDLAQFEPPFITYCSGQNTGKDFVMVTAINSETVSYIAGGNKPKQISKANFLEQWQKIVFVAEASPQSGEKDYPAKLKIEKTKQRKLSLLYAGIAVIIGLWVYQFSSSVGSSLMISASVITLTKLLGVAITVLLLVYEVDKTNSFVKNICTAGKQTNCDAVINSKAGKIFGISWGEAGFFYFTTTFLFLLWPGLLFNSKLPLLTLSSTLVAAYIPFSIYYQWKVVKQWCPLCLATQAILAIELIWAITNFWLNTTSSLLAPLQSFAFYIPWGQMAVALLPIIIWYILKPLIVNAKTATGYKAAYKRLLYNPTTFNNLLQQQATAPPAEGLGIDIGNPGAANTIIKVCNPYCGPCAKAHPVLEDIIQHNHNVKVKVIFTARNTETDKGALVVKHLLAIQAQNNLQQTEKALDDWYMAERKEYEIFAAKYPMNGALTLQADNVAAMANWCNEAEISHTPTIFVNGKRLPETYNIEELKHIL
jgi:uncharacterized membrane protein